MNTRENVPTQGPQPGLMFNVIDTVYNPETDTTKLVWGLYIPTVKIIYPTTSD